MEKLYTQDLLTAQLKIGMRKMGKYLANFACPGFNIAANEGLQGTLRAPEPNR